MKPYDENHLRSLTSRCLALCMGAAWGLPVAQAQPSALSFRVLSWQPASSSMGVRETPQSSVLPFRQTQSVKAPHQLCLTGDRSVQTLVQLQPTEGGEARYLVVGGGKPDCAPVGEAWNNAATREVPWFKNLFAVLDAKPSGGRVTARTAGSTPRSIEPSAGSPTAHADPCGLYPTAQGAIHLPSGSIALTVGTALPNGTTANLVRQTAESASITTKVVSGMVQWPDTSFLAGEHWRVTYQLQTPSTPSAGSAAECSANIVVQPRDADPLKASRENSPRFSADDATVQATLVAAQLDDPNLAAWHAWLLGTLSPTTPDAQDLGATLWRVWWNQHRTQSPADKIPPSQ